MRNWMLLFALVWALTATAALVPATRIARGAALQPTAVGREYWAAVLDGDSETICALEDLTQVGETRSECVAGWDLALKGVKATPRSQRPRIVHQGTIQLGPNYYADGYRSYKPDGTLIISMALLIADNKVVGVL